MKIIDKNIADQTRGIFRSATVIPAQEGIQSNSHSANEWRDIPPEKGSQQVLSDEEIFELSELVLKIEKHYGFPCDIEWAREVYPNAEGGQGGKFYIVQSRPITTLQQAVKPNTNDSLVIRDVSSPIALEQREDWETLKSPISPLILAYNTPSWTVHSVERYGEEAAPLRRFIACMYNEGETGTFAVNKTDYCNSARYLLEHRDVLQGVFNDFDADFNAFNAVVQELEFGTKKLRDDFETFLKRYHAVYSSGAIFDGFLLYSSELVDGIKQSVATEHQSVIDELLHMPALSFAQREHLSLLHIATLPKNEQATALEKHRRMYHWVLNNYKNTARLPLSYFEERLGEMDVAHLSIEIKELEEYEEHYKEKLVVIRKRKALNEEQTEVLTLLGKIAYYVDRRKMCNLLGNHWIGEYVHDEALRLGIPLEDALLLTKEEFEQITIFGDTSQMPDISRRREKFVAIFNGKEHLWVEGEQASRVDNFLTGDIVHDVDEVRGASAYKGVVRGRAKVFAHAQEKEIEQGDVLVTSMTRPDFVPLMKKAIAIVTDEGGITSHAAIVSRELKKPCIIGTKIATQVLHDGDLVEVDAERGVVTILERADSGKKETDGRGALGQAESGTKQSPGAVEDKGVVRVMTRKPSLTTYVDVDVSKLVKVHTREMSLLLCTLIGHSYRDAAKKVGLEDFFNAMADRSLMVSNDGVLVDLYRMKSALQEAQKQLCDNVNQHPLFLEDAFEAAKKERELVQQNLVVVEGLLKVDTVDKKTLTDAYVLLREIVITYFLLQATPLAIERVLQVAGDKVFLERHSDTLVTWRKDFHELQQQIEALLDRFVRTALKELFVDFNYYTDSEVSEYLAGNGAEVDVSGRQKGYALLWLFENDVPYELATGERYSSVANHVARLDEDKQVTSGLYKGTGIGGGVVEGKVYLVKTVDDISQTPEGAIIVANVLELEHLSRVKQIEVAGIVTEEGGITSHIAITGRELGIPIVMGVTGITNDIASGDALSVDADTGVVTVKK